MINYDSDRGVSVSNDADGSTLSLAVASVADSGNYTCEPEHIRPSSVVVHVLSEGNDAEAVEQKGAHQGGGGGGQGGDQLGNKGSSKGGGSPPSAAVQSNSAKSINASYSSLLLLLLFLMQALH